MRAFRAATVAAVLAAPAVAGGEAFVPVAGAQQLQAPGRLAKVSEPRVAAAAHTAPAAGSISAALGLGGLLGYGAGFGVLLGAVHGLSRRTASSRTGRHAEPASKKGLAVVDKDNAKLAYLTTVPRTIMDKKTVDNLLAITPREQWEDPPEGTPLYTLKLYAETYGEGKATKMSWWDFVYLRVEVFNIENTMQSAEELEEQQRMFREACEGRIPVYIPGPAGWWDSGAYINWRGKEPFAGDQIQSPLTHGAFGKQFIENLAFYREGLKPWQRGLEIGIAHGYFIIGPFVSLGPLRNTPEAATVGLLSGVALIGIVSLGGLLFGATQKPTRFDRPGDAEAAGYQQMINWHAVGGFGGAGFAHALITIFGS